MAVKRSQSAARVLQVLEAIARHQPVGVSELARLVDHDKSAVQRAIMTLADSGWIKPSAGKGTRWELTARIHAISRIGYSSNDLRRRARRVLEDLREACGETVLLNVHEGSRLVVLDVLESRHLLRTVPEVGTSVPTRGSATARVLLPHLSLENQVALLGSQPTEAMLQEFTATQVRGYAISDRDVALGSTSIAAPISEADGRAVAAVVVTGPSERITNARQQQIGALVRDAARRISRDHHPQDDAPVSSTALT